MPLSHLRDSMSPMVVAWATQLRAPDHFCPCPSRLCPPPALSWLCRLLFFFVLFIIIIIVIILAALSIFTILSA